MVSKATWTLQAGLQNYVTFKPRIDPHPKENFKFTLQKGPWFCDVCSKCVVFLAFKFNVERERERVPLVQFFPGNKLYLGGTC